MRITCRYWRGCLVKALSEALPPKRRLGLERHLQRCPHCRLEQEQLREVARRLRPFAAANYAGPSPAEDAARVKAALRRAMDVEAVLPPQAGRQRRPPSLRWAAGGVILGVLLGVGVPWVARVYEARRPAPYQVQGIVVSNPVLGPIAGAHVAAFPAAVFERDVMPALYSAGHWAARPVAETFANSRGHFTLPLRRPGKYFLVSKNGERSVPLVWEVTCPQRSATRWHSSSGVSGTLLQGVDSRAPAETRPRPDTVAVGSITGRALLPGGKAPAVAALVVPYSTDGPFKGSDATFDVAGVRFYARSCPESFTDSQGKYVLTDLPAGEYRIAVCPADAYLARMSKNPLECSAIRGRPPLRAAVESGPVQVHARRSTSMPPLTLTAWGHLSVLVRESDGKAPVQNARVSVGHGPKSGPTQSPFTDIHFVTKKEYTDANGWVTGMGLPAGRYWVVCHADGRGRPQERYVDVLPGKAARVEVDLLPKGTPLPPLPSRPHRRPMPPIMPAPSDSM